MSDTIRVITTCTSRKHGPPVEPVGPPLPGLSRESCSLPAELLYAGEQHRRLMAGVHVLRVLRPVELWVISAKAGLISGTQELAPYDESFVGLGPDALRGLADGLRIPQDLRSLVAKPAVLTLLLVGNDYFDAAELHHPVAWGAPTLVLASSSRTRRLPSHPLVRGVTVDQALAKSWSLPLTLLKGELVGRLLSAFASQDVTPEDLFDDLAVRMELLTPPTELVAC